MMVYMLDSCLGRVKGVGEWEGLENRNEVIFNLSSLGLIKSSFI